MGYTARNFRGYLSGLGAATAVDLSVTDDLTVGDDLAVTGDLTAGNAVTEPTASTLVLRTASGYLKDRADSSEIMFPGYRRLVAELGYTALDALYRFQEASGNLKSRGNNADPALTVTNTPTFARMDSGFQGIYMDNDGDCFGYQQDVLDFAANSVHLAVAFVRVSDTGAIQSLVGRYAAERYLMLHVASTDKLAMLINDGTRTDAVNVSETTLVAGGIYLAQLHLRKDLGTLKGRVSRWGTGLLSAEVSLDVSAYTTLTGGTTPGFMVGSGANWGTGINFLGALVRIGAEAESADRMATLAAMTGFE